MRCVRALVVLFALGLLTISFVPVGAAEGDDWPDPASATIRPGVRVTSATGTCTSNFIFTAGADVFLGTAAHCFTLSSTTVTNGCQANSRPLGTPASIQGAVHQGVLAYSSWIAMRAAGEPSTSAVCQYNDFALVRIHPDDVERVSPAARFFGGPSGMAASAGTGSKVISFGNSPLRPVFGYQDVIHTGAHEGYVLSSSGGGWSHIVYTATPGIPGDSGSGVMTGDGRALGIRVTLYALPFPGANGVTNLARALDYANAQTSADYELATGPVFTTGYLPG